MIEINHASRKFGQTIAIDDISFDVKEGETFILLGTSGCGKTTTLRMINRLIEPSGGNIKVNGKDIMSQSPEALRRGIGYVLQHNSLFPHYTVAENIATVPGLLKWDKKKTANRTKELIEKLHLSETHLSQYPGNLSGGQQQRVNIARALAADPAILLMDEPFGALDTITRTNIRKEFGQLDELKKKTIVMVTHDVQEAFELGDRICLMDKGKIVQAGKPAELLFHPENEFVKTFLSNAYLQLALQTVKLKDIWLSLPDKYIEDQPSFIQLSMNDSIWNALERHTGNGGNTLFKIINDKETRYVNREVLLNAFSRYKNN